MHQYQFFQNEYDTNTFIFGTYRLQITDNCIFIACVILKKGADGNIDVNGPKIVISLSWS